jgi:RNA polymerase sigma factor (sigma-70 family)
LLLNQANSPGDLESSEAAPTRPTHRPSRGTAATTAAATPQSAPQPPYSIDDLYRRYAGSLYWVCLRYVKNREDAEDLVNQVFLKVHAHLAGFQGQSSIYSWMYRIAVNECIQLFRKRKFEVDGAFLGEFEDSLPITPEREWIAKLTLDKLFRKADAQTVEIVFLLYSEGFSQDEVVETIGLSRSTLNRKLAVFKQWVETNS